MYYESIHIWIITDIKISPNLFLPQTYSILSSETNETYIMRKKKYRTIQCTPNSEYNAHRTQKRYWEIFYNKSLLRILSFTTNRIAEWDFTRNGCQREQQQLLIFRTVNRLNDIRIRIYIITRIHASHTAWIGTRRHASVEKMSKKKIRQFVCFFFSPFIFWISFLLFSLRREFRYLAWCEFHMCMQRTRLLARDRLHIWSAQTNRHEIQ